jgi:hypothetical protein
VGEAIGNLLFLVLIFGAMHCLGIWDAPTPDNVRKLDAELQEKR